MITNNILIAYFPIAGLDLNIAIIFGIGLLAGLCSGLLGVGGGFISTPLMASLGVAPSVAVATSTYQVGFTSFSGLVPRLGPKKIDFKLGLTLGGSSILGALIGIFIFQFFTGLGKVNTIIAIFYLTVMGCVSITSFKNYFYPPVKYKDSKKSALNFGKVYFKTANVEASILIPIFLGIFTGILAVIMGIGGGFILVPAMVAMMKVENDVAIGTSLLQILISSIFIIGFHIFTTGMLDILLGTILIAGSMLGSQISSVISLKIGKSKIVHLILGILALGVSINFGLKLLH